MPESKLRLHDPDASLTQTVALLERRGFHPRRRLLRSIAAAALSFPIKALACSIIPTETQGPFPGDGSNGPNVLTQSGILRSDIRSSFGSAGTAMTPGTPLTLTLRLVSTIDNCTPLAGFAIYIWHCNATGRYSLYSPGATAQNWLRGVQITDADGQVTFTTIFPGAYSGRYPHIHFEIYAGAAAAVSGSNALKTSQLAMPDAACRQVYAQTALYGSSLANLDATPLAQDMVFADDGAVLQTPTISGSVSTGYAAALEIGIAAEPGASSAPDVDQQGLTGVWYEPASSGQGLALEVYADLQGAGRGYLQGGWFTFDVAPAGGVDKQRWYTFGGPILAGTSSASLPLHLNTGGNFDAAPVTNGQQVGSVTISFSSCTAGEFAYAFSDGSGRSGTIPITRITPNVTCSATANRPTNADFALSGNWYDPSTSGQGFIVEVNPNAPVLFFAWYTYATNGASLGEAGQRWFTGQGAYSAGARSASVTLYETTGGIFDTDTPATQATIGVGSATLTFNGCESATLAFDFTAGPSIGATGMIALTRVGSTPSGCAS